MRIRLDRTMCDGFGICAKHAPGYFSLDDWGYASLIGDGAVSDGDEVAVKRALLDCPVHAIVEMDGRVPPGPPGRRTSVTDAAAAPEPDVATEDNEAISEFVR